MRVMPSKKRRRETGWENDFSSNYLKGFTASWILLKATGLQNNSETYQIIRRCLKQMTAIKSKTTSCWRWCYCLLRHVQDAAGPHGIIRAEPIKCQHWSVQFYRQSISTSLYIYIDKCYKSWIQLGQFLKIMKVPVITPIIQFDANKYHTLIRMINARYSFAYHVKMPTSMRMKTKLRSAPTHGLHLPI